MNPKVIFALSLIWSMQVLSLVDEPTGCLSSNKNPCWFKTQSQPADVRLPGQVIHMAPQSIVERRPDFMKLLEGRVWIEAQSSSKWVTNFTEIEALGDFAMKHSEKKTSVQNLSGDSRVFLKISRQELQLPVGFENWVSGLDRTKAQAVGTLRPLDLKDFLVSFSRSFRITHSVVQDHLIPWQKGWSGNVERSSQIYSDSVHRQMASLQEQENLKKQRQKREIQQNDNLRKMFREKNGLEGL